MFVPDITTEVAGHTMDHIEMRSNLSIAEMTSEQGRHVPLRLAPYCTEPAGAGHEGAGWVVRRAVFLLERSCQF